MIKQMVSFTTPQYHAMQKHAAELGITFAELVRRCVDVYRLQFGLMGEEPMGLTESPSVEILVEDDKGILVKARMYHHDGCSYVEGFDGKRYVIRVSNPTMGRIETVVSVDGLDVHDGKKANVGKSGFVIHPRDHYDCTGFRVSHEKVATFRFGGVEGGYAASKGDTQNVGVIGVAAYQEKESFSMRHHRVDISFGDDRFLMFRPSPSSINRSNSESRGGASQFKSRSAESKGLSTSAVLPEREYAPLSEATCSVEEPTSGSIDVSPALATQFGEARESRVTETKFDRKTDSPWKLFTIRYESRENLIKLGIIPEDEELQAREQANPFPESSFCEPPAGWGEDAPVAKYGGPMPRQD
jgi:hypothetical protein